MECLLLKSGVVAYRILALVHAVQCAMITVTCGISGARKCAGYWHHTAAGKLKEFCIFPASYKEYIMKPYSQTQLTLELRIFNYRLSWARGVIEIVFGILASNFRLYMTPIGLIPEFITLHRKLHSAQLSMLTNLGSYCVHASRKYWSEHPVTDAVRLGEYHQGLQSTCMAPLQHQGNNRYSNGAKVVREKLCEYFSSDRGEVPWQWNMV